MSDESIEIRLQRVEKAVEEMKASHDKTVQFLTLNQDTMMEILVTVRDAKATWKTIDKVVSVFRPIVICVAGIAAFIGACFAWGKSILAYAAGGFR